MRKPGIYAIVNTINGKQYIGSSVDIPDRWRRHKSALKEGTSKCMRLQNAWNKYGPEAFEFKIIEVVESATRQTLAAREQHYFDTLQPEYNVVTNLFGPYRFQYTEEEKASKVHGKKRKPMSDEQKELLRQAHLGRKYTPEQLEQHRLVMASPEVRKKMSESRRKRITTEETRAKMSQTQLEIQNRPEVKEHQRQVQTGKKMPRQGVERGSEKRTGQKRTIEQRENISQGHLHYTPEQRESFRQGRLRYLARQKELENDS